MNKQKDDNKNTESWRLVNLVRQRLVCLSQFGVTDLPQTKGTRFPDWTSPLISDSSERSGQPPQEVQGESREAARSKQATAEVRESQSVEPVLVDGSDSRSVKNSAKVSSLQVDYPDPTGVAERRNAMNELSAAFSGCPSCDQVYHHGITDQVVPGSGSMTPKICFLGEGQGAVRGEYEQSGKPFSGEVGELLDKIIEACGFAVDDVYILNTVCRPPEDQNMSGSDSEILCWPYAVGQLEILQPEFICCLGSVAAKTLLETHLSIGRLRQGFHQYRGSRVMVTYHPAYLLRNPDAKKLVWDDMKLLIREMGI